VPQAWYNKQFGIERLTTETGAGQWGSALSFACKLIGLECKVFMVRISFDQKPFRKLMMQVWGGNCVASPSQETKAGRDARKRPQHAREASGLLSPKLSNRPSWTPLAKRVTRSEVCSTT
jgi:tryptophan synthase beta chain